MKNPYNNIEAIKKAILSDKLFYSGISLPTIQGAGTHHQKATYAYIKAQEFYEKHFLELTKN